MPTGQIFLIAAGFAGLWWAGHKTVDGVKKVDHAIVRKFHHKKPATQPVK